MPASVVGLDFGDKVIRAAELTDLKKSQPRLVSYGSIAVPPGALSRGEVVEKNTVAAALKQLWSTSKFSTKRVVFGMGNHRVLVRDVSVPHAPMAQIRESLPFQVQDYLPVPVGDALLDFYPISAEAGDNGEVVNGLLVAAVKEPVLRNVEAVQAAGLDPVDVDLVPFALSRSLIGSQYSGTVALVHVGATTSSIVIATNGVPKFVRILPNGGEDITAALMTQLSVTREQADQIKRGLGLAAGNVAPSWQPAVDVMQRTAGDLVEAVRNTLSFYLNSHAGTSYSALLVSGGGSMLPGLPHVLGEATRIPVTVPTVKEGLTLAKNLRGLDLADSGLAVAAGLAIGCAA